MSNPSPLVVVTGGAGFIGSHTVDALVAAGYRVIVLDNFSTGKRQNLARWLEVGTYGLGGTTPSVEIVACDVAHGIFAALAPWTAQHGPVHAIIHLAAQVSVVHSVANPLVDATINYGGTLHVLEYARAHKVANVVFASSAAIYGDVSKFPVDETLAAAPLSPYGIDKYASELALAMYHAVHGVPTKALRFFNVYGPRQDPSSPYSGVISIFADRAKAGLPLRIFGDGQQTRDFVYVGDVARAILAAMAKSGPFEVCNVGTGREITVRQLAETILALQSGSPSSIEHAAPRAGEIQRSVADVRRLAERLGIVAATPLAEGLRATLT